jgi:hypothetical protein
MQYENGQSLIGKNLLEAQDLYLENSPLFTCATTWTTRCRGTRASRCSSGYAAWGRRSPALALRAD